MCAYDTSARPFPEQYKFNLNALERAERETPTSL